MTIHGTQTLDGFAEQIACCNGVRFTALDAGTVIHVRTRRSRYRLVVMEPPNRVLVTGGTFCPEPVEARLVGATATGGMVKPGWIGIGLRLEMRIGRGKLTTSPVEDVTIDGRRDDE